MNILKKLHIAGSGKMSSIVVLLLCTVSCNAVYNDLDSCPSGAELRFVYDYHMERGNAFMYQVDCLTAYFYDADGNYVTTRTVTDSSLADENWRMLIDLPAGTYQVIAYGGMACDKASFQLSGAEPGAGSTAGALGAMLKTGLHDGSTQGKPLHDHFWGTANFTITDNSPMRDKATVEMRKNTNNIRIVLQHLNGDPVDPDKFDFSLTTDNTRMAADNSIADSGNTIYTPWAKGMTEMGILPDGTTLANAYAQISTARLVENPGANPRIRVTRAKNHEESSSTRADDTDDTVFDLDLIWLVKLARQQHDADDMPLQEYLDRESRWSFVFLLDENDNYYNLRIKVNDWVVRINNIENL